MDKTFGLGAERSGVRIPGRGKCSLRTTAVDARAKYPLLFVIPVLLGRASQELSAILYHIHY